MTLSQKEKTLLKDMKSTEQLCVDKYARGAKQAKDKQLKDLFSQLSQCEQQHYDLLAGIEKGTVSQPESGNAQQPTFTAAYGKEDSPDKKNDSYLCSDVLVAEKHTSHLYDTCVFEFKNPQIRDAINAIQKQEQNHGKMIFDYMSANGMYS